MPASSRRRLAAFVAAGIVACARNPAPPGWLAPAPKAQADAYGAWIVVTKPGDDEDVSGEFLAIGRDSVFVLPSDSLVRAVPLDSVLRAEIASYDAGLEQLVMWTVLGSLSTASNGYFLVMTLPVWVFGGSIATSGQSRAALNRVEERGAWDAVRMYARFPGGLPENLPRRLTPKR